MTTTEAYELGQRALNALFIESANPYRAVVAALETTATP